MSLGPNGCRTGWDGNPSQHTSHFLSPCSRNFLTDRAHQRWNDNVVNCLKLRIPVLNLKMEAAGCILPGLMYGRPSWEKVSKWNSVYIVQWEIGFFSYKCPKAQCVQSITWRPRSTYVEVQSKFKYLIIRRTNYLNLGAKPSKLDTNENPSFSIKVSRLKKITPPPQAARMKWTV